MPFYPTPNQDDGYDISDYLGVDPRLGDLGDVVEVIRHAHDRGLRVLADLVVNHTSNEHPWFQAARADRESPFRSYYVWSDDPSSEAGHDDGQLDVRRRGRPVLPAPLPALPARPRHHHARRPGRDRQDGRVLARRSASTASAWTPCRSCARTSARRRRGAARASAGCTRCASTPAAAGATSMLMGEVNVAGGRARGLLRGSRRGAAPAARLPHQPAAVARRSPAARRRRSRT